MHAAAQDDGRRNNPESEDLLFPSASRTDSEIRLDLELIRAASPDLKTEPKSQHKLFIQGDSRSGILLSEASREKAALLANTAKWLESGPSAEKNTNRSWSEEPFFADELSPVFGVQLVGSALGGIVSFAGLLAAADGAVPWKFPVAIAGLTTAVVLACSPLVRDLADSSFSRIFTGLKRAFLNGDPQYDAEKIDKSLGKAIKEKSLTIAEKDELKREIILDLQTRAKIYESLATEVEKLYASVKEIRHQGLKDSILGTDRFSEKAGVSRELPAQVIIDLSQITADQKIREELSSFVEAVLEQKNKVPLSSKIKEFLGQSFENRSTSEVV